MMNLTLIDSVLSFIKNKTQKQNKKNAFYFYIGIAFAIVCFTLYALLLYLFATLGHWTLWYFIQLKKKKNKKEHISEFAYNIFINYNLILISYILLLIGIPRSR
eukprot:100875_1